MHCPFATSPLDNLVVVAYIEDLLCEPEYAQGGQGKCSHLSTTFPPMGAEDSPTVELTELAPRHQARALESYQYLLIAHDEIRLVMIFSREPLRIGLLRCKMASAPPCRALSSTWGTTAEYRALHLVTPSHVRTHMYISQSIGPQNPVCAQ